MEEAVRGQVRERPDIDAEGADCQGGAVEGLSLHAIRRVTGQQIRHRASPMRRRQRRQRHDAARKSVELARDQDPAVQSAHRMGDDVDIAVRKLPLNSVRQLLCPRFAARHRRHRRKRRGVLAFEMRAQAAKVIDAAEQGLRKQEAACEYEIHDRSSRHVGSLRA